VGPLTHAATTKLVGAPLLSGLWMDLAPTRRTREWTHGVPGLVLSASLGLPWVTGWALHVALDTLSHEPGEGAAGQRNWGWLP